MTCELRQCQVEIGGDVANVLMVSTIDNGKVTSLTMRYCEFDNRTMRKYYGEN